MPAVGDVAPPSTASLLRRGWLVTAEVAVPSQPLPPPSTTTLQQGWPFSVVATTTRIKILNVKIVSAPHTITIHDWKYVLKRELSIRTCCILTHAPAVALATVVVTCWWLQGAGWVRPGTSGSMVSCTYILYVVCTLSGPSQLVNWTHGFHGFIVSSNELSVCVLWILIYSADTELFG